VTRKKGGGRESGKPSGQSRVEESGGVPAAANPAASMRRVVLLTQKVRAREARIRDLEERNDELRARIQELVEVLGRGTVRLAREAGA